MFASSVVIRNTNGEILLLQEGDPRVHGKWNLPGGHPEPGESPMDTARREVREEVGLTVTLDALIGVYCHADGGVNFVYRALAPTDQAPSPLADDVLSVRWFSLEEARNLAPSDVLRYNKLLFILDDLVAAKAYPSDAVRPVPPESWEVI